MKSTAIFRGLYNDSGVEANVASALDTLLAGHDRPAIVICIGTDSNIQDSLGPLVGTKLVEKGVGFPVLGTLDRPIHATNLMNRMRCITASFPGFIHIAVDASLGKKEEIGFIEVRKGGLFPGKAFGKGLPLVGHVSILGRVGLLRSFGSLDRMGGGRLGMVYNMAEAIASGIARWERP